MTDDPVTCSPTDEVEVAEELMKTHQIRRVPVVDEEGRCVGIIAQSDLAVRVDEPSVTHEVVREISTE
jgi:CBS domain-containing protein